MYDISHPGQCFTIKTSVMVNSSKCKKITTILLIETKLFVLAHLGTWRNMGTLPYTCLAVLPLKISAARGRDTRRAWLNRPPSASISRAGVAKNCVCLGDHTRRLVRSARGALLVVEARRGKGPRPPAEGPAPRASLATWGSAESAKVEQSLPRAQGPRSLTVASKPC